MDKEQELDPKALATAFAESDGTPESYIAEYLTAAPASWRCFHCHQVFTDYHAAQAHFGKASTDDPECLRELARLGPHLLAKNRLLRTALEHVQHMAEFISSHHLEYSFESVSEDLTGAMAHAGIEFPARSSGDEQMAEMADGSGHVAMRRVIDHFELWKCGDDADGYNVAADRLAEVLAKHTTTTRYYFDENGKPVQIEWNRRSSSDEQRAEVVGCSMTGLPCVPGCDRKTCAGMHIPLDQWPASSPSPAVATGGVTALLDAYEAQVKLTPLGHENIQRGRSTYNWKMAVIAELRKLAALTSALAVRDEGMREGK